MRSYGFIPAGLRPFIAPVQGPGDSAWVAGDQATSRGVPGNPGTCAGRPGGLQNRPG
jgi:hypothetical protein